MSEAPTDVASDASAEAAPPAEATSGSGAEEHPANTLTATEPPTTQAEPPTSQLLAGSMGDRCANCGTPMASDQRYCVNCGERRGAGRFGTMAAPTAVATRTVGPPPDRRSRPSTATWIAGIATLLIALGVGVLIGKAGNNTPARAQSPEVITVNGGGSTPGTSSGSTGSSSLGTTQGSSSGTTHHSHGTATHTSATHAATKAKAAAKASKPTTTAVKKASQAASGVTGGGGGQSNNTVTTGGACKAGSAGCTNGHFSGNFFGGG